MAKPSSKTIASTRHFKSVTEVLEVCLELSPKERDALLASLESEQRELKDDVAEALSTKDVRTDEKNLKFLSAVLSISKEDNNERKKTKKKNFEPFSIGKYLILQDLGTGGMAQVFRGKARGIRGFERAVALKRILDTHVSDPQFRSLFEFEAHLSSLLHHPNIVQVFDFFSYDGGYYLAMEFVHGKNVLQILKQLSKKKVALPHDCSVYIVVECLKGLEYAHTLKDEESGNSLNIVHRDISPKNVMVGYGGEVKLVDFGIAKARGRSDHTQTGGFRGTVAYVAPEIVRGAQAGPLSDVFSAGLVLFELLSGKRLFDANDTMACLEIIRRCDVEGEIEALAVPTELKEILKRALKREPAERYQSAEEFLEKLQSHLVKAYPEFRSKTLAVILRSLFQRDLEDEKNELKKNEEILADKFETQRKESSRFSLLSLPSLSAASLIAISIGSLYLYFKKPARQTAVVPVEVTTSSTPLEKTTELKKQPVINPIQSPPAVAITVPEPSPAAKAPIVSVVRGTRDLAGLCPTILRTNPKGAELEFAGKRVGTSPTVVRLPCGKASIVSIRKDGFKPIEKSIHIHKPGSVVVLDLEKE